MAEYRLLYSVNSPDDLKKLREDELPALCEEIRHFLAENISKTGGHLASNLGAVELSVALHRVFSSPKDHIMFDVGHQAYVHKILTGRRDRFSSLRRLNGISGFLRPDESEHDCFVSGHASNSVSAALGMARADKMLGRDCCSVCVIGDGALTGGMAYEALNDAGSSGLPIIIVLNDNGMSIGKNVGGLTEWFSKMRIKPRYFNFKFAMQSFLRRFGKTGERMIESLSDFKDLAKQKILPANIFSVLGFYYLGVADGNDIKQVENLLSIAKRYKKPTVIHLKTVKGKGYSYSEDAPERFHCVSSFDCDSGKPAESGKSFSDVFGECLSELAARDERICAVTAAMEDGTGLAPFKQKYPQRFFDVGIAEQHAAAMSAGMAAFGLLPVFAVYSTFLQRAYDQLLHDVAINKNHVVFAVDRAGPVGADGATHHGLFDVSFLRTVPGMAILAPSSFAELRSALQAAIFLEKGPAAVRYPRGGEGAFTVDTMACDACVLRQGADVTLVSYGIAINRALAAAKKLADGGIDAEVIKLNRLDRLNMDEIIASVRKTGKIVVCEDCIEHGSVGEDVAAELAERGICVKITLLNYKNDFSTSGTVEELSSLAHISIDDIAAAAKQL